MQLRRLLAPLLTAAVFVPTAACVATGSVAGADGRAATSSAALTARALYARRCGACHAVFDKSSYTPAQWRPIVEEMSEMAHLPDAERDAIMDYLTAR